MDELDETILGMINDWDKTHPLVDIRDNEPIYDLLKRIKEIIENELASSKN